MSERQTHILPVNIVKEPRDAETEIRYAFSIKATDITAAASDDYSVHEQAHLFIDPDRQRFTYIVRINDDALIEGMETFQFELLVAQQPHFRLGSITRITITIIDDDIREDGGGERGRGGREQGREEGRKKGKREGE